MSCRGCLPPKRHKNCHSTCPDYPETVARAKLIREERRKASLFNGVTAKTDKSHDKIFIRSVREGVK